MSAQNSVWGIGQHFVKSPYLDIEVPVASEVRLRFNTHCG